MAESTTTTVDPSSEPDKYFKGKQWYSAKRGEWIGGDIYFRCLLLFSQIVKLLMKD